MELKIMDERSKTFLEGLKFMELTRMFMEE